MPSSATRIVGTDPHDGNTLVVEVAGGVITAVHHKPKTADTPLAYLSSGLVDLQVNGFRGHDLNGPVLEPATVHELALTLLKDGVTTFLPTFITASEAQLIAGLMAVQQARQDYPLVRSMVPCVHVEGPSISPESGPRGAHPPAHVREPSVLEFQRWQAASGNLVGIVHPDGRALDDPLPEFLGAERTGVVLAQRFTGSGQPCRCGGRHNAVDHAVGESAMVGHPARQRAVAARRRGLQAQGAQTRAVVREVVA